MCKYNVVFIEMLTLTNSPPPFKSMTPFILPKHSKCDVFRPSRPLALFLLMVSGADSEPLASQLSGFLPHAISKFNDCIFQCDD